LRAIGVRLGPPWWSPGTRPGFARAQLLGESGRRSGTAGVPAGPPEPSRPGHTTAPGAAGRQHPRIVPGRSCRGFSPHPHAREPPRGVKDEFVLLTYQFVCDRTRMKPPLRERERKPIMTTADHVTAGVRHPLEPLTAEEIEAVSRILTRDRGLAASARFVYVTLREPAKDVVLRHQPGEAFEREAHVVLRERAEYKTYEAVVSITAGEVRLWREVPGVQPAIMLE